MPKVKGFTANQDFFKKAGRALGFKDMNILREFPDNEIDAGCTTLKIDYKPQKDNPDLKDFECKGDGKGFKLDNTSDYDIEMKHPDFETPVMTWGRTREYQVTDVGNFGIGMSVGLNEFVNNGVEPKLDTTNGKRTVKGCLSLDKNGEADLDYKTYENGTDGGESKNMTGTKIVAKGIPTKVTKEHLKKILSVTYSPWSKYNDNVKLIFNGKPLTFVDPMYQDLDDDIIWEQEDTFSYTDQYGTTHDIPIIARGFFDNFVHKHKDRIKKEKFDISKGGKWLPVKNYGLYVEYNNRYICLGEQFVPGFNHSGHDMSGFRALIRLSPIHNFTIFSDKSSFSESLDLSDTRLDDLKRVVKSLAGNYLKQYKSYRGKGTLINEKLMEKLNKELNNVTDVKGLASISNAFGQVLETVEKRVFKGRDDNGKGVEPKDTDRKRRGNTTIPKATSYIDYLKNGVHAPYFSWYENKGVVYLTLNQDSLLVQSFLSAGDDAFIKFGIETYYKLYSALQLANESDDREMMMENFDLLVKKMTDLTNIKFKK